jgi:16S rRNA G1207 methylase RsmC
VTEHYYSKKPTSKKTYKEFDITINDTSFTVETVSGLFSLSKLDKGTQVLLKYARIPSKGSLLDLGCGWGPVALYAKLKYPDLEVHASDVNERAVEQTKKNAKRNNVHIKVCQSDGFENIQERFDVILFNPPQTAGKQICLRLIENAKDYLKKGGSLQIVARTQKGGKSFAQFMKEVYGNVEVIGRGSGYSVYCAYV